jgi:hypothetical protein
MTFADVQAFLRTPIASHGACFDCHAEGGDLPQVFKDDDTLYDTLMTRAIERCENRVLVAPGDPENSALYLVLNGTCGTVSKMPSGCFESPDGFENNCSPLEDRERLRLWIEDGAPR